MMLNGELKRRTHKLEQEQKARLEADRRRAERERIVEDRVRAKRQVEEEEASRRRAAAIAEAELDRQQHEEEVEQNRGVWWQSELRAQPLNSSIAQERGIRRDADKDVSKNGSIFFELRASNRRSTHVGSLDFSAREGEVAIPSQVAENLWGSSGIAKDATLIVTYRTLPKGSASKTSSQYQLDLSAGSSLAKMDRRSALSCIREASMELTEQQGSYVRLQPSTADFHQEQMEDLLVAALSKRSAISVGDILKVEGPSKIFTLRVQQLKPAAQVSVIDTEMEADVEPSRETEERLRAEEEAKQQQEAQLAAELAAREAEEAAERDQAAAQALANQQRMQESAAALPEEPGNDASALTCVFRFPDGSRHIRRFRPDEPSSLLYTYADAKGSGGFLRGQYRLTLQFPRRPVDLSFQGTLLQAGFSSKQETVFLEPISAQ